MTSKATEADAIMTKPDNNCNWDNSQLSGLLFSSSPPHPPNKIVKIEQNEVNAQVRTMGNVNEPELESSDSGFDDLLRELDSDEWDNDNPIEIENLSIKNSLSLNNNNNIPSNACNSSLSRNSFVFNTPSQMKTTKPLTSTSLAFCSNKNDNDGSNVIIYSAADSIYDTASSTPDIKSTIMMPMIDISTPLAYFTSQKSGISPIILPSKLQSKSRSSLNTSSSDTNNIINWIVMLPESFTIETLQYNILKIDPSLHLNPIAAIKNSNDRRIKFPVAVMIRDFRGMGGMIQVRLVDGNGNEMGGSLSFSACSDLGIKLHFGLVLILNEVKK